MVRSIWLGPVSALLALAGQAGAQSTPYAQSPAPAAAPQEQTISIRELGKPVRQCRVLSTWKQADGTVAYSLQALDTGEKMTIVEGTVAGPGSTTTTTHIFRPSETSPVADRSLFGWMFPSAPATRPPGSAATSLLRPTDETTAPNQQTPHVAGGTAPAVAAPAPAANRSFLGWLFANPSTPPKTAVAVARTTPTTSAVAQAPASTPTGSAPSAVAQVPVSPPLPLPPASAPAGPPRAPAPAALAGATWSASAQPVVPPSATPAPDKAESLPTRDWRQSWGSVQGAPPVEPTPALAPTPKAPVALSATPVSPENEDPLLHPEAYSHVQSKLLVGPTVPPSHADPVTSAEVITVPPAGPVAAPHLAAQISTPAAPVTAPPGMKSVLAANAPELTRSLPAPPRGMMPPVEMNAFEANAFSTPVEPKPMGPTAPAVAPGHVSPEAIPPEVLALLPKGVPDTPPLAMPPLPPDPTGMERQARLALLAQSYPPAGVILPPPPRFVAPPPMMMAEPVRPAEPAVVQTSSQLPLDATTPQLVEMLRGAFYPSQREWAALQLSTQDWHADPGVVMSLMTVARSDSAPLVRAACVRSLAGMTTSPLPVADTLQALCQDPDPRVRQEAEQAVGGKGH